MADALKLRVDVGGGRDIAVGKMAEVEFHPALEAPFERNLVDRPGALALVHRRMIVPGRIEMRAVVRRELHALDRPPLPVRQILSFSPGKNGRSCGETLLVVDVFDLGTSPRRIRRDVILQRHGNIDNATAHRFLPQLFARAFQAAPWRTTLLLRTPILSTRSSIVSPLSRKRPISSPQQLPTVPEPKNSPAWIVSSCEA